MLIDSFKQVYNKTSLYCTDTLNTCEVRETTTGSTMNLLKIENSGCQFSNYTADLVKDMPSITTERTECIKDKDCDGVIFRNIGGQEDLILVELKSGFDTGKICDAFNQVLHSFLKVHVMLSACKNYDISTYPMKFIVACRTFKDEAQEAGVLEKISNAQTLNSGIFEDKFLARLLVNKYVDVKMDEFHDISANSFSDDIKNKHIQMRLCLTNNYADTSISTSL